MEISSSRPTSEAISVHREISIFRLDADNDIDVLEALANQAEQNGWVTPTFRAALIAREKTFPTGLPTQIPVAIPHADTVHVLKPGLGIAVLARPVQFGEMGGAESYVDARVAILILVRDPREQVLLLTRLIGLFQAPDWLDRLEEATDLDGLVAIFSHLLTAEAGFSPERVGR